MTEYDRTCPVAAGHINMGLCLQMPAVYSTITVGAPCAHLLKFKGGVGIGTLYHKLLSQQVSFLLFHRKCVFHVPHVVTALGGRPAVL